MTNPMPSPSESVLAMFLMSMTNFGDYYSAFEQTNHEVEAKVMHMLTFKYCAGSTITLA
jgi:hypothetical protein